MTTFPLYHLEFILVPKLRLETSVRRPDMRTVKGGTGDSWFLSRRPVNVVRRTERSVQKYY